MTAKVLVVQLDADEPHWRLEIAVRHGPLVSVSAVTYGTCRHNFMNAKWAEQHGLVISHAPVFKLFLQDDIDDHSNTVFYVRRSVRLSVGRFGATKIKETFLIFDPLDTACENVIINNSNLQRVRSAQKASVVPAKPVTTADVSKGTTGPSGTGRIKGTHRLGVIAASKTPKPAPTDAPNHVPTSTHISFETTSATNSTPGYTKVLPGDVLTRCDKLNTEDMVVSALLIAFRDMHFANMLQTVGTISVSHRNVRTIPPSRLHHRAPLSGTRRSQTRTAPPAPPHLEARR